MLQRDKNLLENLYFLRSIIDDLAKAVPEAYRMAILTDSVITDLQDAYSNLVVAVVDYEDMLAEMGEEEISEQKHSETNDQAYEEYGEDFNKLVRLVRENFSRDEEEPLAVFIGRNEDGTCNLQVIDVKRQKVKRKYLDPSELSLNLTDDIQAKFNRKKLVIGGPDVKKIDFKNKENNRED